MTKDQRMCVVVLESQYVEDRGYVPSIVKEGESGHFPLTGQGALSEPWYWGHDFAKAEGIAAEYNARLGLSPEDVDEIKESSIMASIREDAVRAEVDRKLGR